MQVAKNGKHVGTFFKTHEAIHFCHFDIRKPPGYHDQDIHGG
jgi:hypothetical protein